MYRITYVLGTDGPLLEQSLRTLLAALTMTNRLYLRAHKDTPPIYKSGVRYQEEFGEQDDWQDIPTTLRLGYADSEDLACWRAAELQERGIMAWPTFEMEHGSLHPRVRLPGGQIEDPAEKLGMRHVHPHKPQVALTHRTAGSAETRVTFVMGVFHGSNAPDREQRLAHWTLRTMLGALTTIDIAYLKAHPEVPALYDSGCYYELEPAGREDWQDVPTNLRRKSLDCEDAASHRAAELQVRHGIRAWPSFTWRMRPSGAHLYHIQTRYPDGQIEDPSRVLGMGR